MIDLTNVGPDPSTEAEDATEVLGDPAGAGNMAAIDAALGIGESGSSTNDPQASPDPKPEGSPAETPGTSGDPAVSAPSETRPIDPAPKAGERRRPLNAGDFESLRSPKTGKGLSRSDLKFALPILRGEKPRPKSGTEAHKRFRKLQMRVNRWRIAAEENRAAEAKAKVESVRLEAQARAEAEAAAAATVELTGSEPWELYSHVYGALTLVGVVPAEFQLTDAEIKQLARPTKPILLKYEGVRRYFTGEAVPEVALAFSVLTIFGMKGAAFLDRRRQEAEAKKRKLAGVSSDPSEAEPAAVAA